MSTCRQVTPAAAVSSSCSACSSSATTVSTRLRSSRKVTAESSTLIAKLEKNSAAGETDSTLESFTMSSTRAPETAVGEKAPACPR